MPVIGEYEPLGSREGAVIAALRAALARDGAGATPLNSRASSATGVRLDDRFVTRLEVLAAHRRLPLRVNLVLWCRFGPHDLNQTETARRLHLARNTVATDEAAGLQYMVRVLWEEPDYVSPPRVRPLRSLTGLCGWLYGRRRAG